MKNVIIHGASGNIAKHVIDILVKSNDINLTLIVAAGHNIYSDQNT
jgi:saccharopine dehydrogenase-like NADP-dependent oxidoreductase